MLAAASGSPIADGKWLAALAIMFLASAGFWIPDVLVHAMRGYKFGGVEVLVITAAMPLALWGTVIALRRAALTTRFKHPGVFIVAGIWLSGGCFMTVGASFSGGGFMSPGGTQGILTVLALSLLPMYTFMMATYDGSLGAVLLVTVGFVLVGCTKWLTRTLRQRRQAERGKA